MLKRLDLETDCRAALSHFPVVALLGPRQSGKTTLARRIAQDTVAAGHSRLNYLDLEDPAVLNRLQDPLLALEPLRGLVIIDEIQRQPELFPLLRVLADREGQPATFLILGSASRELLRQSSESLAGRIKYIDVMPFGLDEVGLDAFRSLWLRGGYPRSFLAVDERVSDDWRAQYVRMFLEYDLGAMGLNAPPATMRRLWMMLCHFHGQILNTAEIAQSLDISATTAKRYIDVLCSTFMLRRLHPWYENIGKRQVKSAKIYFRDSGIFHYLLGIKSESDLLTNPALGRSWEGFVLEQLLRHQRVRAEDSFFWGVHGQGELDLLVIQGGARAAYEVKYTMTPKVTPAMVMALEFLKLDRLHIVYPGDVTFELHPKITALGLRDAFAPV